MISEQDLKDAIAECQGVRNPTANTCIKLAAYYTILNQLYGNQAKEEIIPGFSFASEPTHVEIPYGNSDFSQEVMNKGISKAFPVIDELMDAVMVLNPKLYRNTMDRLSDL